MNQSKVQLRRNMRSLRDEIDREKRQIYSDQITETILATPCVRKAKRFFVYVSFRSEVQTHDLINRLLELNKDIYVPVIDSNDRMQVARFTSWDTMRPDAFGVLVPRDPMLEKEEMQVAIVPGLAFTASGARIGYGKGHYDRFFADHIVKTKIGIAFDCQIIEEIPTESFDYAMDFVISESQTLITEC